MSPYNLGAKLNLARRGGSRVNRACSAYGVTVLIEEFGVVRWHREVGSIENIKHFRPELDVKVL